MAGGILPESAGVAASEGRGKAPAGQCRGQARSASAGDDATRLLVTQSTREAGPRAPSTWMGPLPLPLLMLLHLLLGEQGMGGK